MAKTRSVASASSAPSPAPQSISLRPLALVIFLVSAAGLTYEVVLTRIFSLLFQYHFAFLALSLAVLGISLGAAVGRVVRDQDRVGRAGIFNALLALSLSFPIVTMLLAFLPSTASIVLHVLIGLVPFVLIGLVSTFVFADAARESGRLYAADLVGAGLGVLLALGLLSLLSAFAVVMVLGVFSAAGAWVIARAGQPVAGQPVAGLSRIDQIKSITALIVCGLITAANAATGFADYAPTRLADAPPDKTLLQVLKNPDLQARVVYSTWNPFARIDVVETNDPSQKLVFTDGGAGSYMLRANDGPNFSALEPLRFTLEFLPFADKVISKTLILGAGAGKDVDLALLAGSPDITAVEVNPAMVATTRRFGDYNGHVFDRPNVAVHTGDARAFVESSRALFDLIYLNVVYSQAAPPASQALVENYIFTAEAFRAYLRRLTPNGKLAFITHNGLEGTRAAITALQAMQDMGIPPAQALDHIALLMQNGDDPTQRPTALIVSLQPFTPLEIQQFEAAAQALNLQPLHVPTVFDLGFKGLKDGQSLERFVSIDQTYDLFPTTDNRPFFYKLDPGLPTPITAALIAAVIFAIIVVVLALGQSQTHAGTGALLLYVALIGAGFMLIEIPLIQRLQLLIGTPTLSIAIVLGTLLLSGGVGSWISQRWPEAQLSRRVLLAAVAVMALALIYGLALPSVVPLLMQVSLAVRIVVVMVLVVLVGVPMGIPFPSALRLASIPARPTSIALLWAANGAFSVVGSTLAMVLAMSLGFQWALLMGVVAYAGLAVLTRGFVGSRT